MKTATHTDLNGKGYIYRIVKRKSFLNKISPLFTGVEFYDTYTNKWRESIMTKCQLKQL